MNGRHLQNSDNGPKSRNQPNNDNPVANRAGVESEGQRSAGDLQQHGGASGGALSLRSGEGTPATSTREAEEVGLTVIRDQLRGLDWKLRDAWRPTPEQAEVLSRPVDPDWVEVRYPNVCYLPAAYYRKVLDEAFGLGGWQLVEAGQPHKIADGYYQAFVFKVDRVPIMKKIGAYVVKGENQVMTPGNALEAVRSNAEMRVAKELGVARELWWPAWCRKWCKEYCVEVDRTKRGIPILARRDDEAGYDALRTMIDQASALERDAAPDAEYNAHWEAIRDKRRANQRPLSAETIANLAEQTADLDDWQDEGGEHDA